MFKNSELPSQSDLAESREINLIITCESQDYGQNMFGN